MDRVISKGAFVWRDTSDPETRKCVCSFETVPEQDMRLYKFVWSFDATNCQLHDMNAKECATTKNTLVVPTTEIVSIDKHACKVFITNK